MWQFIVGICIGAILTLASQLFLVKKLFSNARVTPLIRRQQFVEYKVPQEMQSMISPEPGVKSSEAVWAVNSLLQFMFQEHKDANPAIRNWVLDKIKAECEELMQTSKVGKIIRNIKVQSVNLGEHLPTLCSMTLTNFKVSTDKAHIEEVEVTSQLTYSGGCEVSLEVSLPLEKNFRFSVKVKSICGPLRLCFTRTPYTHWWFSFAADPVMDLEVQSHLQGHSIPQITTLLVNQIKRTIRRKHTLPNYKMRLKPLFSQLGKQPSAWSGLSHVVNKRLSTSVVAAVTSLKASRLPAHAATYHCLYCVLTVGKTKYEAKPDRTKFSVVLERGQHTSYGLIFTPRTTTDMVGTKGDTLLVIDRVSVASPAHQAGIRKDDIVMCIDGISLTSHSQAAKLMEKTQTLRLDVERDANGQEVGDIASLPISSRDPQQQPASSPSASTAAMTTSTPAITISAAAAQDKCSDAGASPPSSHRISSSPRDIFLEAGCKEDELSGDEFVVLSVDSPRVSTTVDIGSALARSLGTSVPKDVHNSPPTQKRLSFVNAGDTSGTNGSSKVVDAILKNCTHRTKMVKNTGQIVSWTEKIELSISDEQLFLTAFVIGMNTTTQAVVGYVNVSLPDVLAECEVAAGNEYQLMLGLTPTVPPSLTDASRAAGNTMGVRGLELGRIGGDLTLRFRLYSGSSKRTDSNPDVDNSDDREDDEDEVDEAVAVYEEEEDGGTALSPDEHHFATTLFRVATYCDFCSRKVWFKNALQCSKCAMVCHRKCLARCRTQAVHCDRNRASQAVQASPAAEGNPGEAKDKINIPTNLIRRLRKMTRILREPETPVKEAVIGQESMLPKSPRDAQWAAGLSLPLSPPPSTSAMRRAHSASALEFIARQTLQAATGSKVLAEPANNPADSPEDASTDDENESEFNFVRYLKKQEESSAVRSEEAVVTAAKEMGKELFATLEPSERLQKLEDTVAKLQQEIDMERMLKVELSRSLQQATAPSHKRAMQDKVVKSEEKIQALAVLLLHYCSGLQHCVDHLNQNDTPALSTTTDTGKKNV